MMGLWADGWFYISSAGLLISGILFFFLLGQYRVASEAADATEGEQGAEKEGSSAAIRPVYIPDEAPVARIVSHPVREAEARATPEDEYRGPDRRKNPANTTDGISPAVVYLQNIKGELTELHQELRNLAKRVDNELAAVSTRDEALIDRLSELARAVDSIKTAAPAETAEAPAPRKVRKAEKVPEPTPALPEPPESAPAPESVSVVLEPESKPKAEPALSPDESIRLELGGLIAPAAEPEAKTPAADPIELAPAASPAEPEPTPEEKPRRGPVWPV